MLKSMLRLQPKLQPNQCRQRLYNIALLQRHMPGAGYKEKLLQLAVTKELQKQHCNPLEEAPVVPLPAMLRASDWLHSEQWQAGLLKMASKDKKMFMVLTAFH
ncbi:uncharacterized protein DMAD_04615 [Drosophila madeirensis]|uniref:Uncharacterized protein n=1 Tax=Drosophila madeirensis TaxID=30013 RepID=A0AAU9GDL3_DROMD